MRRSVATDYVVVGAFLRETGDGRRETEAASSEQRSAPSPASRLPSPVLVGFAIYGPTMATDRTYDLYWIAVDRAAQGRAAVPYCSQT